MLHLDSWILFITGYFTRFFNIRILCLYHHRRVIIFTWVLLFPKVQITVFQINIDGSENQFMTINILIKWYVGLGTSPLPPPLKWKFRLEFMCKLFICNLISNSSQGLRVVKQGRTTDQPTGLVLSSLWASRARSF